MEGGSPFSIVFPGFIYMIGRVTLGGGLSYLLTIQYNTKPLFKHDNA